MAGDGGLHEPGRDELAATRQVTDLFATEALLALDRFERSFPSGAPEQPRQTADRLAYWWRELRLDEVRFGSDATDTERILATAAELALDPANEWGVTIEEATAQANTRAALDDRTVLGTGIEDFRQDFEDSYGGRAQVPSRDDEWLKQSLTRLSRAAVLRDVVALGAKVKVSEPLRAAADQLVRQGQRLTDDRRDLAAQQAAPVGGGRQFWAQQAQLFAAYTAYSTGVSLTGAPVWAEVALKAPACAWLVTRQLDAWRQRRHELDTRLDPAQAQLRSVRADLVGGLDGPSPIGRRDARAIRGARDSRGPGK